MKNPKILLIAIGGVTVLLVLGLGVLVWLGLGDRAEQAEQLASSDAQVRRLDQLPVRPGKAALDAVKSNETLYVEWRTNAIALVSRGDRAFPKVTPPAFKTFLVTEARRLSSLPGAADGKIVKPDFPFGFKDYITGGVLPARDDLPRLQREWSDIATVVELLATNGVAEILDVRVAAAGSGSADAAKETQDGKAKAKSKAKGKGKAKGEAEAFNPAVTRFDVEFLAKPDALVGAVNAFVANPRYIVVEGLKFAPEKDALVEALGGEEKKMTATAAPTGRRARRRAAARTEETKKDEEAGAHKTGTVTDPLTEAPIKVTLTFAVYDFRSKEEAK